MALDDAVVQRCHEAAYHDWPLDTEEGGVTRWWVRTVLDALKAEGYGLWRKVTPEEEAEIIAW